MFGVLLYDILFFGIPVIVFVLFVISLIRFVSAKSKNKKMPGSFSDSEIKKLNYLKYDLNRLEIKVI